MKQNYNLLMRSIAFPRAWNHFSQKSKTKASSLLVLFFMLLGFSDAFGQTTNTFTTSSTWTAPANVTSVTVQAWGAGGKGGSSGGGSQAAGGGGGAFAQKVIAVIPGTTYNVEVGIGGTGATLNGGDSFFINNTTILAKGGIGVNTGITTGGNGGAAGASIGDFVYRGGNGSDVASGNSGAGGGGAGTTGNGGDASGTTAGTGTNIGGGNGGAGRTNNGTGNNGVTIGGGGGGAKGNNAGGSGARGEVRITFTCPPNTPSAGTDQTLAACSTTTTLAGSAVPVGMTGAWTVIAGTATVTTPSSPTSGVTAIVPGTPVTLRWTVTNGVCGSSFDDVIITSPVGAGCLSYCVAGGSAAATSYISNVTLNTINQSNGTWGGYRDYSASVTTNLIETTTYTISVTIYNATTSQKNISAWVDWNLNGVFDVGTETILSTTSTVGAAQFVTLTNNFAVPIGASADIRRLRVELAFNSEGPAAPCNTNSLTDVQDYGVIVNAALPCVAPTAQPTALNLSPSGNNISGSFTAASPVADNYLVLVSTNPVAPTAPVNGTTYTIGSIYQAGYTVVDNDSNTNFNATGLLTLTTYYFYIYSFNSLCTGGPLYLGTSPLTGNATTLVASYCTPSSTITTRYIVDVFTTGNITNLSNLGTGYSPTGYADYTALPPVTQIPGGGVAVDYYLQLSRQNVKIWVDWNNDGTFTDAAPELVYQTGGTVTIAGAGGFVVPPATLPGNYRIRIRTRNEGESAAYGPCGLLNSGETEDYTLTVVADCLAKPNALYDGDRCGAGTVVLGVEGSVGVTEFRFYDSLFGGTLIGTAPAVAGTTNWTTPALAATTNYYVTAYNGVCESWYRQKITAEINPVANIVVTPSIPEVCGENNVVQITAGGDFITDYLVDEDFEGGGFGMLNRVNVDANADTQWTNRTSPYVPTGSVWKPAITSNAIGNMFACANSDFAAPNPKDTQLRTANLDASAFSDLYLSFRHYFSYYPGEPSQFADVDVSTNGGGAWTNIASYTSNQGYAGEFNSVTIDLSAYAGLPQVMIRFRYNLAGGSAWADGWALDDVQLYGTRPLNTTFTWSGGSVDAFIDPACTTPYVAQSVTTVYVRPTAGQLASTSWSFIANATLGNGCPISENITINNKTKLWKGGTSGDWYDANNWEPIGVPDANTCVYIYDGPNDSYINTSASDAYAKIVTVRPNGLLQIEADNTLTVTDEVTVDAGGTFNIENSGSLIQVNNVVNSGTISMKRNVNIRRLDYVYWSSPVANYGLTNISTTTYRYKWLPTIGTNTNGWGNWSATSETMVLGKGYIVRGPESYTTTLQNYTQNFIGVPNNGTINMPISRGIYDGVDYSTGVSTTLATKDDDNWNLIGNPYPSAVNANLFLATNTNIAGFIKYWTHGTLPSAIISDPFYNNYVQNYTVGDYVTYNATGANPAIGNGNIAAGQGFFVRMNHTSAATTENVVFDNSMRRNDYRNDLFYRNANATDAGIEEKNRIWLNLISPASTSSTTLIGYVDGATNELDRMYDAPALGVKTNFELYSFSNTDKLNIQGKALPFNSEDQIPLGINISQNGIHTIGISTVDGLFEGENQDIYLEDKTLGITHNLRAAPYSFTGTTGTNETRFVLKFNNETLGNEDFTANAVTVYTNESIQVSATNQNIASVKVYDLLGRALGTFTNVNSDTFTSKNIAKTQSALLVEVTLENGATKTYKVIF